MPPVWENLDPSSVIGGDIAEENILLWHENVFIRKV